MSDEQKIQIDKLGRALELSNRTILQLETRLKDAHQLITIFEKEKKMNEQAKKMQETIIKQQIQASDAKVKALENEILDLRAKLKKVA
jgi:hypothetical protein